MISKAISVLYLSLKYHYTYPCYIEERMAELLTQKSHSKRYVLLKVDCNQSELHNSETELGLYSLNDIYVAAAKHNTTVLLCWSDEEAARYLQALKTHENRTDIALEGIGKKG